MRKLVAAIGCRNHGARLYAKPLQNLDIQKGYTVLDNILSGLSRFDLIEDIVLGIAEGDDNLEFVNYANDNGLSFIIGDEIDVLSRLIMCAESVFATDVLRITSDSPFPCFQLIEDGWRKHVSSNADATFLDDVIDGCGFEIIRVSALQKSYECGGEKHRSEMCTLYIREHKSEFEIEYITPPEKLIRRDLRLTVDYPEDLIVCRAVYKAFFDYAPLIPLEQVVQFLDDHQELGRLMEPFCTAGYKTMYL